ncbi:MAG: hypothetical protein PHE12_03235 [Clostridia bacterium]|nr:hypothetical protein [Clostridia bacterium]
MKKILYNFIFFVLVAGSVVLTVINLYSYMQGADTVKVVLGLLCIAGGAVAALVICITAHELGHILAGIFLGFKVVSFRILKKEKVLIDSGDKTTLKNNYSYGGCELLNTKEKGIAGRFLAVTAAGLLFSFVVLGAYMYANIFLKAINPYVYFSLSMGMTISLYIFLASFLPADIKGSHTDGGIILGLTTKKDYAAVLINLIKIQTKLYLGTAPSKIDKKLYFNVPLLSDDHISMMQLYNLRHLYYLDKKDFEAAAKTNQRLKYFSDIMTYEEAAKLSLSIVFDNILQKDYLLAKENYLLSAGAFEDKTALRIKAYYNYYVLNDKQGAVNFLDRAKKLKSVLSGIDITENNLIDELLSKIENSSN